MATSKSDEQVQKLFDIVQEKKKEIASLDKPNWITNGSFSYTRGSHDRVNIFIISDPAELIHILAFLGGTYTDYIHVIRELDLNVEFSWMGYSIDAWNQDLKTRLAKIQISDKKKQLENLEERLNSLISPEKKKELELAAISKELGL
jgi:hypothetical protein